MLQSINAMDVVTKANSRELISIIIGFEHPMAKAFYKGGYDGLNLH